MYKLGLLTVLVASVYGAEKVVINHGLVGAAFAGYPYAAAPAYAAAPYALPAAAAPVVAAAPAPAPYVPYAAAPYVGSQFHAQDEFKNLNYGYSNLNSAKHEIGNGYAGVNGGYSYVDANGELQTITYVADGAGFRVEDSRLPVFNPEPLVAPTFNPEPLVAPTFNPEPLVAPTFNPELPVAPEVTPEVAAATAEHLAAVEAAKAGDRKKRDADAAVLAGSTAVITPDDGIFYHNAPAVAYAGYGYGLPYGAYHGAYAGAYGYAGLHGLGYAGYPYLG